MAAPEIVDHGFMIALGDISVGESSGWRPSQQGVVKKFVHEFPSKYGAGIHRVPRALLKDRSSSTNAEPKFAEDALGKAILDDGKSTIQALSALMAKFEEGSLLADTCRPNLLQVFRTKKLAVQLVFYATDDALERIAHNAQAHDEDNNDYLPTTLAQKIKLVMQLKETVLGGDWGLVEQWFVDRYGPTKRSSVRRNIVGARSLSPALLEFVEERALRLGAGHGLSPSYFLKNDFFCGVDGKKAAQRLDHAEQLLACQVMAAIVDSGRTISLSYVVEKARPPCYSGKRLSTTAGHYPSPIPHPSPSPPRTHAAHPIDIEVCRPTKFVTMWARQLQKKYADVVTDDSPLVKSLERTQDALIHKDVLRNKVIECMTMKKTLLMKSSNAKCSSPPL